MTLSKGFIAHSGISATLISIILSCQAVAADTCSSGSTCIFGSNGGQENSLTKEEARQQKQSWDENRYLREKKNEIAKKNIDKLGKSIVDKESCENSLNSNAYWEQHTQRCLNRLTGRLLNP